LYIIGNSKSKEKKRGRRGQAPSPEGYFLRIEPPEDRELDPPELEREGALEPREGLAELLDGELELLDGAL
jgi:hypothetical protein